MIEEWKNLEQCENIAVSNFGRVIDTITNKERKKTINKDGYEQIGLKINGKRKTFLVHRVVAELFIDNSENKSQVNHIDENKKNNNYLNLEWVTPKENSNHGTRTKRIALKNSHSIIAIHEDGRELKFSSKQECAKVLGLNAGSISQVMLHNLNHTHHWRFYYD